jgi:predicted alpha/beta-hydrolase family hydrolase
MGLRSAASREPGWPDMETETFAVDLGEARTTAVVYRAREPRATIVLAPGAGAPQTHPWMVMVAEALSERALEVVTFNFLYSEAGRRVPDRNDLLEETWRAVIAAVRVRGDVEGRRLYIGGKSMGGRIATQVAAGGDIEALAGLVLLGYPLHPPGKPHQLRTSHLPRVRLPMLFIQGSRDAFGTPDELGPVVRGLSRGSRLFVIDGGDHSLKRPKSSGQSTAQTIAGVADEIDRFTAIR